MHFEILVEDSSGKACLEILMPKLIGEDHTYKIINYKGIGRVPKDLQATSSANQRILLDQLPRLLRGYGETYPPEKQQSYPVAIIVVCDLDNKDCSAFRQELLDILVACNPQPETRFCIAIEEGESWFLGDIPAIKRAYPKAKDNILSSFINDSICGTWEYLADAVYPGGKQALQKKPFWEIGAAKHDWAISITPHMDIANNKSNSFQYFCRKITELINTYS